MMLSVVNEYYYSDTTTAQACLVCTCKSQAVSEQVGMYCSDGSPLA